MGGIFRTRIWMAAGLALAAAACTNTPPPAAPVAAGEEPNPITIRQVAVSHPVRFEPGVSSLSQAQRASLLAFLHAKSARPGETATVQAGSSPLDAARLTWVMTALRQAGLEVATAPAGPGLGRDTLEVSLERSVAVLPHCPNWTQQVGSDPLNAPSTNLGCATAVDLAVMVADPHDLVSGRTPGPVDAAPSIRAVEDYRSGKKPDDGSNGGGASTSSVTTTGGSSNGGGNAQ